MNWNYKKPQILIHILGCAMGKCSPSSKHVCCIYTFSFIYGIFFLSPRHRLSLSQHSVLNLTPTNYKLIWKERERERGRHVWIGQYNTPAGSKLIKLVMEVFWQLTWTGKLWWKPSDRIGKCYISVLQQWFLYFTYSPVSFWVILKHC
jgi:hypothetical protein